MSLAVADKRPQPRNGGCVGIFFQLFSKKSLFSKSKRLLPPPPVKQSAMKFGADDKMPPPKPVLLQIDDENRGEPTKFESDPDLDLESTMQAPGLVARLMGLESMPAVHCEKPRKSLDSRIHSKDGSFEDSRLDQELCVDSGSCVSIELGPQKLQKTGGFMERRPVEAFHKSLIAGCRKKKYMRLETPVKSPRLGSRSSASSRLVQVANKILEPGLQARNRAKFAIDYTDFVKDERDDDGEHSGDSVVLSMGGKESLVVECVSSASDFSYGSEENKREKSPVVTSELKKIQPAINKRSIAMQAKFNVDSRAHGIMGRKKNSTNVGDNCETSAPKEKHLRQSRSLLVRDKESGVKHNGNSQNELNRSKNFVALNKNLNNPARSRSPTRVSYNSRVELERTGLEKNVARRKSPTSRNIEASNSKYAKERSVRSDVINRKGMGLISNQSINRNYTKRNTKKEHCDNIRSSGSGIVSFAFSSPIRRGLKSARHEVVQRRGQNERDACNSKGLIADAIVIKSTSQKGLAMRGDELSSILDEKIRELSSLDRGELAAGDDLQGRSTAAILEDLISALMTGAPELHNNSESCSDAAVQKECSISHKQMVDIEEEYQGESQLGTTAYSVSFSDQPSPVSILEAAFSNDSCSLESLNDNSGETPQSKLPKICNITQPCFNSDLLDSAASLDISDSVEVGVSGTEVPAANEIISDAELFFENFLSDEKSASLDSFLLDILENILNDTCLYLNPAKEGGQLRGFLLDCIMECLDLRVHHVYRSGFGTWMKLPLIVNRDLLMKEVHAEAREWKILAGKPLNDLIENEVNGSYLKWMKCECEEFEVGIEIQGEILQALIDEIVIDMC